MYTITRDAHNPLIIPRRDHAWEHVATFNPCPIKTSEGLHLYYRAMARPDVLASPYAGISTIGRATANDDEHFHSRTQVVVPTEPWEQHGCEDPRVTYFEGMYYLFYTAVQSFDAHGIRVAVAISNDGAFFEEKHLVTPFNAKAFCLFPERIDGKVTAIFTAHTERTDEHPHSDIVIVQCDHIEQLWDEQFWMDWYDSFENHTLDLARSEHDHVEVGTIPVKTDRGWLLIYSYAQHYFDEPKRLFTVEAALLHPTNPQKVLGRTRGPILVPETLYEIYGLVPDVVFPSGALIEDDRLDIYYGGADTTCNRMSLHLDDLLDAMDLELQNNFVSRASHNPILKPIAEHDWEAQWVFNAAAFTYGSATHLVYRAMSPDNTSRLGYARLDDGLHVDTRLKKPIYEPRTDFEIKKKHPDGYSGCEDPRTTVIDDTLYMTYTAYNGVDPTRVALSHISLKDFMEERWENWSSPVVITPPHVDDKNTCILPEKIDGQYMILHRLDNRICADLVPSLDFEDGPLNRCIEILGPRHGIWDSAKVGITGPPLRIPEGWLLIYHGVSENSTYRLGAALLDADNPTNVLARTVDPILEPVTEYEKHGQVDNVVFSCGVTLKEDTIYIYYGGADTVMAVGTIAKDTLVAKLLPPHAA